MIICIFLVIFRPHPTTIDLNQKYIDSITILKQQQKQSDSLIINYKDQINLLDNNINQLQNKQVKTRIEYRDKITPVPEYTPTQLDSFFKQLYND